MSGRSPTGRDAGDAPGVAPRFEIPGTDGSDRQVYRLDDFTDGGVTVVAFFPKESIGEATFLAWLKLNDGVDVLLVSDAHPSAIDHSPLAADIAVPVLGDPDGAVADEYGVDYDAPGVVFLIDGGRRILRTWHVDVDPEAVHAAVKRRLETETGIAGSIHDP